MGQQIETLEDLLRPGLKAVCVGINPAPASVAAGHYYQGPLGQKLFGRLGDAGALPSGAGYEDDLAFASGIGFTDIVKRPTSSAGELGAKEYRYGRDLLLEKLARHSPRLVIFTFKKTAEVLLGRFKGNGFIGGVRLAHSDVFVMPGPYEAGATAHATLRTLSEWW